MTTPSTFSEDRDDPGQASPEHSAKFHPGDHVVINGVHQQPTGTLQWRDTPVSWIVRLDQVQAAKDFEGDKIIGANMVSAPEALLTHSRPQPEPTHHSRDDG